MDFFSVSISVIKHIFVVQYSNQHHSTENLYLQDVAYLKLNISVCFLIHQHECVLLTYDCIQCSALLVSLDTMGKERCWNRQKGGVVETAVWRRNVSNADACFRTANI